MKRILLLLAFTTIALNLFAGHSQNTRKNCKWLSKRYAANAHLATSKCGFRWSTGHKGDCTWAFMQIDKKWGCNCFNTSTAMSQSNSNGHSWNLQLYCGTSGGYFSELFNDLDGDDEPTVEYDAFQNGSIEPIFKDNQISIENINFSITSNVNDPRINTQTIAIWRPIDDIKNEIEDTLYSNDKALVYGTVSVTNGAILISGTLFSMSDFEISSNGNTITVTYIGGDITFDVPENLNIDDLAVNSSGDVIPDEEFILNKYITDNNGIINGNIEVTMFPNPTTNNLNITFNHDIEQDIEITIYDINGKRLYNQSKPYLDNIDLDVSMLNSGMYFILFKTNNFKTIKQFNKQ